MNKLILNEDLFDAPVGNLEIEIPDTLDNETPAGPAPGAPTGIADELIKNINDEWTTISNYNKLIANMEAYGFDYMIPTIQDILNEEHLHIGQLQELLKTISPNTDSIEKGEIEGEKDLEGDLV